MSDQTQAYAGQDGRQSGTSEWNRLDAAIRSTMNKMATMTLVRVVAVRGRIVDVQPIVAQLDGAGNAIPHGTIHNVPVWRVQGGGAAVIIVPTVGDIGLAVFAHSDISRVKTTGNAAPPGSRRRFDWADAIYMGGLFGDAVTTSITLSGSGGITIDSSQPVVINAPVQATQGLTVTGGATIDGKVFADHVHKGVQTGGGLSGPVGP